MIEAEEYLKAIYEIANRPELNDLSYCYGQYVPMNAVRKVLIAEKLFKDELEKENITNLL